jgi:hypothetical protein
MNPTIVQFMAQSKIRYFAEESKGIASGSCCMTRAPLGCFVTLQ